MGRHSHYKRSILNKFKDLTDEQLLLAVHESISEYVKLKKSIEVANIILLKYNQSTLYYDYKNSIVTKRYNKLVDCAMFRNLKIPEEWYDVEIEEKDIINKINRQKYEYIDWIDKHNYLFDLIDENSKEETINNNEKEEFIWPSDKKKQEISLLYNEIIAKEFGKKDKKINNTMIMPKRILPSKEEIEKLGFVFLESEDENLYNVIIPEGWKVEEDKTYDNRGTEKDKSWNIYDEYGNLRGTSTYLPTLQYYDDIVQFYKYYYMIIYIERGTYEVAFQNQDGEIIYTSKMGNKEDVEELKKEVELFAEEKYKDWKSIDSYWPKEKKKINTRK